MKSSRVVTPEEIEGALGLPVLAVIPHLERRAEDDKSAFGRPRRRMQINGEWRSRLLSTIGQDSPAWSEYDLLAKALLDERRLRKSQVFLVTSFARAEGVSLTCANLALAAMKRGMKALVIEGPLRAPRVHSALGLDREPGVTEWVQRQLSMESVLQTSREPAIDVIATGRAAQAKGIWRATSLRQGLAVAKKTHALILIDAPPLGSSDDIEAIAAAADGCILVHNFGRASLRNVRQELHQHVEFQEKWIGVVLNDIHHA
jgi:Mrp family chromosome partitioning ATPase